MLNPSRKTLVGLGGFFAATALLSGSASAAPPAQPTISSRQIPVIAVDGLKFRDLNRNGQLDPYEDWRLSPEERATDLVSRMSLAEKAGTMMHGGLHVTEGDYDVNHARNLMLNKHISSTMKVLAVDPSEMASKHNAMQEIAEMGRLGIPLTISADPFSHLKARGSGAAPGISSWPEPLGFGAIGDAEVARQFGKIARGEYRAMGIHMTLSPMADLATEPRWGRIFETFGEDPKQVRKLVRAYIEGFQGSPSGLTRDGVISVVKHWAGYGAAAEKGFDAHNDYGRWSAYPGGAFEQHLVPYEGAFEVNVSAVMPTYAILRDLIHEGHQMEAAGGAFNRYLITDLLRGRYGFKGIVLSDWRITGEMAWGMQDAPELDRYVKAVQAGIDQFGGTDEPKYLIEAVEHGLLPESRLDEAAHRILVLKFQIGLFESPFVSPERAKAVASTPASHAAALDAQRRSLVLLKNENARLPLQRQGPHNPPQRVYLLGISPDAAEAKGLTVVPDFAQADLAIVRLKTPRELLHPDTFWGRLYAEGNLALAPGQPDFDAVVSLAANGLPVIATVNLERPAVLTALLPHVKGLFADFGITDSALLDVILGEAKPEGRLPFELPSSMAAVEAQKPDLSHDSENPLFPIRFGLRYAK